MESGDGITRWEGFDVELIREISRRAGFFVLAEGKEFANFSEHYRSEATALKLGRDGNQIGDVSDVASLVQAFRDSEFRLGLRPGVTAAGGGRFGASETHRNAVGLPSDFLRGGVRVA